MMDGDPEREGLRQGVQNSEMGLVCPSEKLHERAEWVKSILRSERQRCYRLAAGPKEMILLYNL